MVQKLTNLIALRITDKEEEMLNWLKKRNFEQFNSDQQIIRKALRDYYDLEYNEYLTEEQLGEVRCPNCRITVPKGLYCNNCGKKLK